MIVQYPLRYLLRNEGFLDLNGREANWHSKQSQKAWGVKALRFEAPERRENGLPIPVGHRGLGTGRADAMHRRQQQVVSRGGTGAGLDCNKAKTPDCCAANLSAPGRPSSRREAEMGSGAVAPSAARRPFRRCRDRFGERCGGSPGRGHCRRRSSKVCFSCAWP